MENKNQVASEILRQLGGNKFVVMTGSKNFGASEKSLSMHLTRNKVKAKYLKITLNGNDLYDMKFTSLNKDFELITKAEFSDIYNDQLQEIFTKVTGLYTHL